MDILDLALEQAAATLLPEAPERRAAHLIPLLKRCLVNVEARAGEWVRVACGIKGVDPDSALAAEEIAGGPVATARALNLWIRSLRSMREGMLPPLPGPVLPVRGTSGKLVSVPVLASLPYDRMLFAGYDCQVWVDARGALQELPVHRRGVAGVLGAGNVTSIAPTDMLSVLCRQGLPVVVKLHPSNGPLQPVLTEIFAPLREVGCSLILGNGVMGERLALHPVVTDVHLTGAPTTFARLVRGNRTRAVAARLTAELGNVTPVVVLPAFYPAREMEALVENIVAMLVQNGGFNCVAAKVLVTASGFGQREELVARLQGRLAQIPGRKAWLEGAAERLAQFTGTVPPGGLLPYTLVAGLDPHGDAVGFREEVFGPVLFETALDEGGESDPRAFAGAAVRFCNERLAGDLAAVVMAPKRMGRRLREARTELVLGLRAFTIGLQAFPALGFAWMAPPWGGVPGNEEQEPRSGIGLVHDPYFLRAPRKVVVRGPCVPWPTPPWWPAHRAPREVMERLLKVTVRPGVRTIVPLLFSELRRLVWSGRGKASMRSQNRSYT